MSERSRPTITFDKDKLDQLLETQVEELSLKDRIEYAVEEEYRLGSSPSHSGRQFVSSQPDKDKAGVRSVVRTSSGQHQITKDD